MSLASSLALIAKLFLPSWDFFNDFSATPRLDIKLTDDGAWTPLYPILPPPPLRRILWNPDGNALLFEHSLVYRLTTTSDPLNEKKLARELAPIIERFLPREMSSYRFRIVFVEPDGTEHLFFTSDPVSRSFT